MRPTTTAQAGQRGAAYYAILVAATFLMASSFIAGKILLEQGVPAFLLVGWRFVVAAAAAAGIVFFRADRFFATLFPARLGPGDWAAVALDRHSADGAFLGAPILGHGDDFPFDRRDPLIHESVVGRPDRARRSRRETVSLARDRTDCRHPRRRLRPWRRFWPECGRPQGRIARTRRRAGVDDSRPSSISARGCRSTLGRSASGRC